MGNEKEIWPLRLVLREMHADEIVDYMQLSDGTEPDEGEQLGRYVLETALEAARQNAFIDALNAVSERRCGANWVAMSAAMSAIRKLMEKQQ